MRLLSLGIVLVSLLYAACGLIPAVVLDRPVPDDRANHYRERFDRAVAWADGRVRMTMDVLEISDMVPPAYRLPVITAARAHGIEPRTLAAVGWVESRWDCGARGKHGEVGCLQILPETGEWIARQLRLPHYDMTDPETNMRMGAWYLRHLLEMEGSLERALAAYNGGPGAHRTKPASARTYVDRVRAAEQHQRR